MPANALEKKSNFEILEYDEYVNFFNFASSCLLPIASNCKHLPCLT